jgi:MarR family 2-MHQ and catechol resistance regulon transcriptional repressor
MSSDAAPVRVFRGLLRAFGLMERVMQPYFARFGISGSQWGVLRNLHRAERESGSGLRISALSERLLIRPPSVSGVVDRLERAGLVEREVDPTDQRARFVRLTVAGRELVRRVLSGHERQIESAMAALGPDELEQLDRLLARLGQHLEQLAASRRPLLEAQP